METRNTIGFVILICPFFKELYMPNPRFHVIAGLSSISGAPYGNAGPIFKLPAIPNVFDYRGVSTNFVLDPATGELASDSGFTTTNFMHLRGASQFVANISIPNIATAQMCFYDANQTFISSEGVTTNPAGVPITVPSGTVYVRFWYSNSGLNPSTITPQTLLVCPGAILSAVYVPFTLP
jgi:hypothetical protein